MLFRVMQIHQPLTRAAGERQPPPDRALLPTVMLDPGGAPSVVMPSNNPPAQLVTQVLVKGSGPVIQAGDGITAHYMGAVWSTGKVFDSSWSTGRPVDFSIGTGRVIAAWDSALVGQTVGSQILIVVPPDLGYGPDGNAKAGIKGTDTLVFVVDLLDRF